MSGQGSASVVLKEYDLSEIVTSFSGVNFGIVVDCAKGVPNEIISITSEKDVFEKLGKPNPKKFGTSLYSLMNSLKGSKKGFAVRVDKGQTYASALVRSKINASSEYDDFGFVLENPVYDKIVSPVGALTQTQISQYQFNQYPRTRVVEEFAPPIALIETPKEDDTVIYVDNTGPIEVGQFITFKDTTGLSDETTLTYKTYQVTEKNKVLRSYDYIEVDQDLLPQDITQDPIRVMVSTFGAITPALTISENAPLNTTKLRTLNASGLVVSDTIRISGLLDEHIIQSINEILVTKDLNLPDTFIVTGNQGDTSLTISPTPVSELISKDVCIDNVVYEIQSIDTVNSTITLTQPLTKDILSVELKDFYYTKEITFDKPFNYNIYAGTSAFQKQTTLEREFSSNVFINQLDDNNKKKMQVSNSDILQENSILVINGKKVRMVKKYQLQNYVNSITLDSKYVSQSLVKIASPLYNVVEQDFEHRDAFLVTASSPGEWGNKISIAIRDSKDYQEAFFIDVHYDGGADPVESWEVSRKQILDGFGRQLYYEDKINTQSNYIRVYDNPFMVDDNDEPVEPLKTGYYLRQPQPKVLYTEVAKIQETVWDGDNLINIGYDGVNRIDVTKPLSINDTLYSIAGLKASVIGGSLDTVVLERGVELNLDLLPPEDRKLNINSSIYQSLNQSKEEKFVFTDIQEGNTYSIKLTMNSETEIFTKTALSSDNSSSIVDYFQTQISGSFMNKYFSTSKETNYLGSWLNIRSKIPGITFDSIQSSNITKTLIQDNARKQLNYLTQKIIGNILPGVYVNSLIQLSGTQYIIRDAGANSTIGGWDGNYPTTGQFLIGLEKFANPEEISILLLLDGGITAPAYQTRLAEIAEARQDCVALLSVDYNAQANPDILKGELSYRSNSGLNSSYAAVYSPWVEIYDKDNDFKILISPESFASRSVSYIAANRELWSAAAGWNNGKVAANKLSKVYNKTQRDLLYDAQINPLKFDPAKGISIFGQKTTLAKPSALSRLNVRMLLIIIELACKEYLDNQLFEVNTEEVRKRIQGSLNYFMSGIKNRGGVYDYKVVCDGTNNTPQIIDSNEMYVDIYLQPVRVAEFITARIVVMKTGANFSEIKLGA